MATDPVQSQDGQGWLVKPAPVFLLGPDPAKLKGGERQIKKHSCTAIKDLAEESSKKVLRNSPFGCLNTPSMCFGCMNAGVVYPSQTFNISHVFLSR